MKCQRTAIASIVARDMHAAYSNCDQGAWRREVLGLNLAGTNCHRPRMLPCVHVGWILKHVLRCLQGSG